MHYYSSIQFLSNDKIDKQKWNECIEDSPDGLIYAKAFYLDSLCPGWSALAAENYDWVLPLTHKTKWGISYLYQPPFTQQLGIYAKAGVNAPYKEIFTRLQNKYSFWDINWNDTTTKHIEAGKVTTSAATNFILNLKDGYESIEKNYHKDLIKNLKRSSRFHLVYRQHSDYNKCIDLYRKYYGDRMPDVNKTDYANFGKACSYALQHNMLICREVLNEKQELMAEVLILKDSKRLYNLMNTTTEAGRKTEANHFLLNSVIREFAGQDLIFDFEGSDLPGVKTFYQNFGAVNQPYHIIKYNALPWPLRMFKK